MIDAVSVNSSTTAAEQMKKETGMNKDDFLKLFVTQLQNQDPLNPMDGTQFIGQLAQLTQVEQAYNTNSNLQNILNALNGDTSSTAVSFIGKEILAPGSGITLTDAGQQTLNYRIGQAAEQIEIVIKDASGNIVRTLTQGQTASGDHSVAWDGRDNNNNPLPAGTYSFAVTGTDSSGNSLSATSMIQGTVDGVKLDGSAPVLTVAGVDVPLSYVLAVKGVN
ncbi:MAG TPA: flagellar hook capping FlgD N-terminal domain-containing protein [Geobacteraceae bacterium]|nr:flagellar hook capping FlgD N-terminal domain-containing protein [Geobacteraceae bacterium]